MSASSVPSLSPYVAPAGGIAGVNSLLSHLPEPCFVAISSRQPGNTFAPIAQPPDRRLLGNGNPGEGGLSSRHPEELKGQAQPGPGGQRLGPEPVCPRLQGMLPGRGLSLAGHAACRALGNLRAQGPLGGSRGHFSGIAEGKAGAGPRPVPSCRPLAGCRG